MATRKRRVVPIPRPPESAFNKDRRAGTLLKAQTVHHRHALSKYLQKVVRHLDRIAAVLAISLDTIKTEGDVSEYSRRVTAILHPHTRKSARQAAAAASGGRGKKQ
jgi:hypothetical protein